MKRIAIVVAAAACIASCSSTHSTPSAHVKTRAATASPSPLGHDLQASNAHRPLRMRPAAASFIDASTGWVLGAVGCQSCAAVWRTTNQGHSWAALGSPGVQLGYAHSSAGKVDDVYFANDRDGYLFGPGLETTRDGGTTWERKALPKVLSLTGSAGWVYALVHPQAQPEELLATRPGAQTWSRLPLPHPSTSLKIAVAGSTIALLETGTDLAVHNSRVRPGRLWISTDAGRRWRKRPVPCNAAVDGGAALISLALGNPKAVLIDCFSDQQSSQAQNTQHHLFGSADDGRHWVRLADPTRTGGPVLLVDNGAGHAFLATEGVRDYLDGTLDHAKSWHRVLASGGSFYGWNDLDFVSTEVGYVVGPTHYAPEHLYFTTDGGRHWRTIEFKLAHARTLAPCRVAQLSAVVRLTPVGAGSDEYRIAISDHGDPCRLQGRPHELLGVSARGTHEEVRLTRLPRSEEHAMLTGEPADLDHEHTADLVLVTGTACNRPATHFRSLVVGVGEGKLAVRYLGGPEPVDRRLGIDLECGAAVSQYEASFPIK